MRFQNKVKEILEAVISPKIQISSAETALWDKKNLNGILSFEDDPKGSKLVAKHHIVTELYVDVYSKSLKDSISEDLKKEQKNNQKKGYGSQYEYTPVILNDNSIYFVNEKRSEISYRG